MGVVSMHPEPCRGRTFPRAAGPGRVADGDGASATAGPVRGFLMNVRVRIQFTPPTDEDWQAMRSLARSLTDDRASVRVAADAPKGSLVAEFTMPTEAQYKALPKIDKAIRLDTWNRCDSTFSFPYTEAGQLARVRATGRPVEAGRNVCWRVRMTGKGAAP